MTYIWNILVCKIQQKRKQKPSNHFNLMSSGYAKPQVTGFQIAVVEKCDLIQELAN